MILFRPERMVRGCAAFRSTVFVHPEGEAGKGFRYDLDASIDSAGKLDRSLRSEGLVRTAGAEVEGQGVLMEFLAYRGGGIGC